MHNTWGNYHTTNFLLTAFFISLNVFFTCSVPTILTFLMLFFIAVNTFAWLSYFTPKMNGRKVAEINSLQTLDHKGENLMVKIKSSIKTLATTFLLILVRWLHSCYISRDEIACPFKSAIFQHVNFNRTLHIFQKNDTPIDFVI